MEFMLPFARLPRRSPWLRDIDAAARRLYGKFKDLDLDGLEISDYNKRYVKDYLRDFHSALRIHSFVLAWSIASCESPPDRVTLLDYGAGSGLLCLLAKELGVGTVLYNDIYDQSRRDARVLAEALEIPAEHYIQGDIDDVLCFVRSRGISCNVLASYDAIEHIYDLEDFYRKLGELPGKRLTVFTATAANDMNPMVRRSLVKSQIRTELHDREKKFGHKERDSLRSFLKIRRETIAERASGRLGEEDVERLAKATRGMMRPDIEKCVDEFLETGKAPEEPKHPTNTCDPNTGNWTEHLLPPSHYADRLAEAGFQTEIVIGCYGNHKGAHKRLAANLLNLAIRAAGSQGIRIAPFFAVLGKRMRCHF